MKHGKKQFYSHIVTVDALVIELNSLELTTEERERLLAIAETHLHHTILDAVLEELGQDDKKLFLHSVARDDHHNAWEVLYRNIENVEEKIKKVAEDLKEELKKDIQGLKA